MSTITPIAPSHERKYGPAPVKKEIKAKNKGRTVNAGMINVRVLVYRKKSEISTVATQHSYRLLVIHEEQNRCYQVPWDIGPVADSLAVNHIAKRVQGLLPSPEAWEGMNIEKFKDAALLAGFEPYNELPHNRDKSVQIGHTIKIKVPKESA